MQMKQCNKCLNTYEESYFYLRWDKSPSKICKACHLQNGREWAKRNPDKRAQHAAKNRDKHRDIMLQRTRVWRENNLEYDAFRAAHYRAIKKKACPPWADKERIKEIYLTCPKGYHVDHIIPLRGKTVSGLHVENNLQHLPAIENIKKRNRYVAELL